MEEVLALNRFRGYAFKDVEAVVRNNDKQRFALRKSPETGRWQIRANQGHTIKVLYRVTPEVVCMYWNQGQCNNDRVYRVAKTGHSLATLLAV